MQHDKALYPSLSTEIYAQSSRLTVFKVVLTTFVLFVAFNIFYYFYLAQYDSSRRPVSAWTAIDTLIEPLDVLIFGDSVAATGIDAKMIEEQTGLRVYNFASTAWWVYYHDVWILERYIEKFGAPKMVIWAHTYEIVNRKFNARNELTSSSYPYGFTWNSQYLQLDLSQKDKEQILLRRLFPLYYRKVTTESIVASLLQGINPIEGFNLSDGGFVPYPREEDKVVDKRAHEENWSIFGDYQIFDDNQHASDVLFEIIDSHQIPTYIMLTPVHRKLATGDFYLDAIRAQLAYWQAKTEEFPTLIFNPEIVHYTTPFMRDGVHMNLDGAVLYTQYLIDWIWGDYEPMSYDDVLAGEK